MTFAENLLNNLIVFFILGSLVVIIYCKIKNQTLGDILRELRGANE